MPMLIQGTVSELIILMIMFVLPKILVIAYIVHLVWIGQ